MRGYVKELIQINNIESNPNYVYVKSQIEFI